MRLMKETNEKVGVMTRLYKMIQFSNFSRIIFQLKM